MQAKNTGQRHEPKRLKKRLTCAMDMVTHLLKHYSDLGNKPWQYNETRAQGVATGRRPEVGGGKRYPPAS